MHPILFRWDGVTLYSYGAALAVAFLVATLVGRRVARRRGHPPALVVDFTFWILISGIVGARLLYVAAHWPQYLRNPLEILEIYKGGLIFYGGMAAAVAVGALFLRRRGIPLWEGADLASLYIPLGHAIGRIGCLLNGCCYGLPTTAWVGIRLHEGELALHPTQVYESLALLGIFLFLNALATRRLRPGTLFLSYIVLYGAARFAIEFARGDNFPRFLPGGLSMAQGLSLAAIAAAGIAWFVLHSRKAKG